MQQRTCARCGDRMPMMEKRPGRPRKYCLECPLRASQTRAIRASRTCEHPGCKAKHYSQGRCKRHYNQQPDQRERQRQYDQRPDVREAKRQRDQQRAKDPKRRAYKDAYDRAWQAAHKDWGAWWESQRARDDRGELRTWEERRARRQRRIDAATRPLPGPRHWIAGTCAWNGCQEPLVFRLRGRWKDADASYCSACRKKRWRENHIQRAKRYGVEWERIDHSQVFASDRYICRICGEKTRGRYPNPFSATVDHIIPLARGGPHLRHNLQTAHLLCNVKKGDRAANDQLRLAT